MKTSSKIVFKCTPNRYPDKKNCVPDPGNGDKCSILWSPNGYYPDKKFEYQKLAIRDSLIFTAAATPRYL